MAGPMVHGRSVPYETDLRRYVNIEDDFHGANVSSGDVSALNWRTANLGGASGALRADVLSGVGPFAGTRTVRAGVGVGAGGFGIRTREENLLIDSFGVGASMSWRVQPESAADTQWFAGMTSDATAIPLTGTNLHFVGLRFDSSVDGNVYFVCKDADTAGNEDTLSLGAAVTASLKTYTARRVATDRVVVESGGTIIGTLTGITNFPTVSLELQVGSVATAGADKDLNIDFVKIYSPLDRR